MCRWYTFVSSICAVDTRLYLRYVPLICLYVFVPKLSEKSISHMLAGASIVWTGRKFACTWCLVCMYVPVSTRIPPSRVNLRQQQFCFIHTLKCMAHPGWVSTWDISWYIKQHFYHLVLSSVPKLTHLGGIFELPRIIYMSKRHAKHAHTIWTPIWPCVCMSRSR